MTIGGFDEEMPMEAPALVVPGTSDLLLVFSTPQSRASTQEASDGEVGDLLKVGLFVVKEVLAVCGVWRNHWRRRRKEGWVIEVLYSEH